MRIFVIVVAIITLIICAATIFIMFAGIAGSVSGSGRYSPDFTVPTTMFVAALLVLVLSPAIPGKKKK